MVPNNLWNKSKMIEMQLKTWIKKHVGYKDPNQESIFRNWNKKNMYFYNLLLGTIGRLYTL